MLVDLHVHTSRYSACGRSSPEEMVAAAQGVGLDGLVITEHNVMWSDTEVADLQGQFPDIRLFRGIEITSADGDDYLIYGLTEPDHLLVGRVDAGALIHHVHALGGVIVLAHPYRYSPQAPAVLDRYPVDGVEVMSDNILNYAHPKALALAERLGAFITATSDGHHVDALGIYAVRFTQTLLNERDLAQALRMRRFTLHVDISKVAAKNAEIASRRDEVRRLVTLGYEDREIREKVPGLSGTIIRGLREGLDVFRPS